MVRTRKPKGPTPYSKAQLAVTASNVAAFIVYEPSAVDPYWCSDFGETGNKSNALLVKQGWKLMAGGLEDVERGKVFKVYRPGTKEKTDVCFFARVDKGKFKSLIHVRILLAHSINDVELKETDFFVTLRPHFSLQLAPNRKSMKCSTNSTR